MTAHRFTLLNARTTDGTDGAITWQRDGGSQTESDSGEILAEGIWDGASITFNIKGEIEDIPLMYGITPLTISESTKRMYKVSIPWGQRIEAVVSGAGASTSLNCYLTELRNG